MCVQVLTGHTGSVLCLQYDVLQCSVDLGPRQSRVCPSIDGPHRVSPVSTV